MESKQEAKDCVEALAAQRSSFSHRVLTSRSWPSLGVATAFELSENFFPEAYTMDSQIPRSCVIVVSSYEYSRTHESITNIYKILYLAAYRRWQWLSLSVEIPCSSMYRAAIQTTQRSGCRQWQTPTMGSAGLLPYSVIKMFQGFLCENQHIVDQSKLCVSLSDCDTISLLPSTTPISSSTLPDLESTDALCRLHDLGCCRFDENDVVQLEIVDPPMIFCSSLVGNGRLVYEIKSIKPEPAPEMLYNIRVLHCMNGRAGCTRLAGIVTDQSQRHLKSYLIDVPQARWNLVQVAGDSSISWERRERWAFQLVQGIRQIHLQGFTIGGLTIWSAPVVDHTDSVRFWYFKERFVMGRTLGAYYPPEFRFLRDLSRATDHKNSPVVTSKTDIFHLGLLLWLLAENKPQAQDSPVCGRLNCGEREKRRGICDLSHAEPIALPTLAETVPQYFRSIVDACRAENPRERPAAREILQMFPFPVKPIGSDHRLEPQTQPDVKALAEAMRIWSVSCDYCRAKNLPMPFYSCKICRNGDFDMCQKCYDDGRHCSDNFHLLAETGKIGSWVVVQRYHSCVNMSGVRDIRVL